jgi:FAD/FMN-containing dehydrogenase
MGAAPPALERLIDQVQLARSHQEPLDIVGGGTKRFYGEPTAAAPLNVTELSGITSYEPTELVVTARAGTPVSELESALAERGQCLPFEPPRFDVGGTVGGMVAAGLSGPARASVGSVRDHVLGVTLLNGNGEILTFGGQVAKNVAGYDVSRLIAGSLGVLGVICEVSLKVLPRPVATATLRFELDESQALQQLGTWNSKPLGVTATAWSDGRLHVRLSGARAAVAAACTSLGGERMAPDRADDFWTAVRDHRESFFVFSDSQARDGEALWRVSVPATAAPLELAGRQFIEWGGAQRWWRSAAAGSQVRAAAVRAGGHATLMRGTDRSGGVFTPLDAVLMRIHRSLKQSFDPAGIFNRGRLYPEL